jgi:Protein of unknown function (DUF1194)
MAMRHTAIALAFAGGFIAALSPAAQAADTAVDLELILAVDISRSMDPDEQQLQRNGYVAAITNPDLITAIVSGPHHRIALSYVEWAGPAMQDVVVDWHVIDGAAAAKAFGDALAQAPLQTFRGTSISGGLTFAKGRFDDNGIQAPRHVIDVSGDGPNNMGMPIELAREEVLRAGITINGLPIMIKPAGDFLSVDNLDVYYQDCVIGGSGAFMEVVRSADQFEEAIRRKLVLEIADRAPPPLLIPAASTDSKRIDCMIGEKLRQHWMNE